MAVVCDNTAGHLMSRGEVDAVVTGADRIAANGDTANKIGTYPLAVLAAHQNLPLYIAAPCQPLTWIPRMAPPSPSRRGIPRR